jgi:hypothetical protein
MTIVSYSVCDYCSSQTQITSGSFCGIQLEFNLFPMLGTVQTKWGTTKKTFCNVDCLIEYVRLHFTNEGFVEEKEEK